MGTSRWPRKTGEADRCPDVLGGERQCQPRSPLRSARSGGRWAPAAPGEVRDLEAPRSRPRSPQGPPGARSSLRAFNPGSVLSPRLAPAQLLQSFLQGTVFPPRSPAPWAVRAEDIFQLTPLDPFLFYQPPGLRRHVCAQWSHRGPQRQRPGPRRASRAAAGPGTAESAGGTAGPGWEPSPGALGSAGGAGAAEERAEPPPRSRSGRPGSSGLLMSSRHFQAPSPRGRRSGPSQPP